MSTVGFEIRKAREAKGLSRERLVEEFKKQYPAATLNAQAIKRLENKGYGAEQLVQNIAHFLAVPVIEATTVKPASASAKKPTTKKFVRSTTAPANIPGAAVPEPFRHTGAPAKTPTAGKVLHLSLNNANGFSLVAARDTLAQLRALGLPTDQVKQAMIQKFVEYVNALDKV